VLAFLHYLSTGIVTKFSNVIILPINAGIIQTIVSYIVGKTFKKSEGLQRVYYAN